MVLFLQLHRLPCGLSIPFLNEFATHEVFSSRGGFADTDRGVARKGTGPRMSKLLQQTVIVAVAAAVCAMGAAQTPQSAARFVGPQLVAHLAAPSQVGFTPASYSLPSAISSSSSVTAVVAAALPPVSTQFESIFVVPCRAAISAPTSGPEVDSDSADGEREPCVVAPQPNTYTRFLDSPGAFPLTTTQKGWLAVHDVKDPGNLATIAYGSAITVALNPHTGFGPGFGGCARASMYSLSEDATQEFFSTFVVSALMHEDPRYHRMPTVSVPRRLLHALAHTVIAQSDSGRPMLNFATLSAYPASAELANLYVPGLQTDGRATAARILTAYATDPVDNLISEFLPDVARHVHVRVIFAQRLLNQISSDDFVLP